MGASGGSYGMGNRNDPAYRQLTFHVPNQAAYSSTGTIPSFGWYSNGGVQLMNLQSATGNLSVTGTVTSADFFKATGNNLKFSAGGNHIFNVDLNGKIYPQTHNAADIGFSNTTAFRNLYLSGTANSTSGNYTTTSGSHNFTTAHGNIQLGPMNGSWAHIYTNIGNGFYLNKEMRVNNNLVWNAGTDGSGSGLDADLLDGNMVLTTMQLLILLGIQLIQVL